MKQGLHLEDSLLPYCGNADFGITDASALERSAMVVVVLGHVSVHEDLRNVKSGVTGKGVWRSMSQLDRGRKAKNSCWVLEY